jgi:nicotinate-nucleotide pyrophosphorylase (carboxylating)
MDSNDELLERFIRQGLAEDVGEGDHTSMACIRSTRISKAKLLIKDDGVLSGVQNCQQDF